jgi:cell division protein FtsL
MRRRIPFPGTLGRFNDGGKSFCIEPLTLQVYSSASLQEVFCEVAPASGRQTRLARGLVRSKKDKTVNRWPLALRQVDWRSEGFRRSAVLGGVLLSFGLMAHGVFGANGLLTLRQKQREYNSLRRQIQQLQQENQRLQQQVQGLRSNPETIGRYAREELHMARPGEVIYVLPPQDQNNTARAATNSPLPKPEGRRQ